MNIFIILCLILFGIFAILATGLIILFVVLLANSKKETNNNNKDKKYNENFNNIDTKDD